jgi:hypothetical protein
MRPPDPASRHPEEGRRRVSPGCWSCVTWGPALRASCEARAMGGTEALRSFVAQGDRACGRARRGPCETRTQGSTEALRSAQGDRAGGRAGYGTLVVGTWGRLSCAVPVMRPPDPASCHPEEGRRRVSPGCWSCVTRDLRGSRHAGRGPKGAPRPFAPSSLRVTGLVDERGMGHA